MQQQRRLFSLLAVVLAVAFAIAGAIADGRQPSPASPGAPLRGLYVTGGGFHDFVRQETILPPGIAERVKITWTIDHSAGKSTEALIERHKNADWTKSFDVVLYNMSFSHVVDPEWIQRIARAHQESGVGAVIVHGAVHSYRRSESKAWGELMGAFSMRHDSQRPLVVEAVAAGHPIMRGVPAKWETISEELYELVQTWPSMKPLAEAYSIESKKRHAVIWTNTHGKARVFVTSLGHNNEMVANPIYLDLVTRGVLWTAGALREDGTAAPGYAAK
jgi:type 1 glutamine amidotransferase